jgi:hypothetical protein
MVTDKIQQGFEHIYRGLYPVVSPENLLEIGIKFGEGLEFFHQLWPEAKLTGIDNVPQHLGWDHVVKATRLIMDQADPLIPKYLPYPEYDLIVDDASHDGAKTVQTFEILWPLVKTGGYYVIEDWQLCCASWQTATAQEFQSFLGRLFWHAFADGDAEYVHVYNTGNGILVLKKREQNRQNIGSATTLEEAGKIARQWFIDNPVQAG